MPICITRNYDLLNGKPIENPLLKGLDKSEIPVFLKPSEVFPKEYLK